LRIALRK